MLRIGLVGVGNHATRNLLPAIAQSSSVELAGICTRNQEVLSSVSQQLGCAAYANADELLGDSSVDVVMLANPNAIHAGWIERSIEASKHVFCEKSLTESPRRSLELLEQAREAGLLLAEMFMFVHHPQWQALEDLVRSKELGELKSVTANFGFPHLPTDNIRYNKALGGGALLDAGAYTLMAARRLLGTVDSLHAAVETPAGREVDTEGAALVRSKEGTHAHLSWGFGRSYRNEVEVWCEGGRARIERAFSKPPTLETQLWIQLQAGNEVREVPVKAANHFVHMLDAFAGSIVSGDITTWNEEARQQAKWLARARGSE